MKRILQVIGSMDCGGAENLIMNLLRNINKNEYKIDFLINKKNKCFFEDEILSYGCNIHRISKFNVINYFSYKKNVEKIFKENKYDVVHGHIGSSSGVYLRAAKQAGCFCVLHSHSTFRKNLSLREKVFKKFSKIGNKYADFFIACSKQSGIDRFGERFGGNNSIVLNNGIDIVKNKFDSITRNTFREKLLIKKDCFVVGHVGRMVEPKNHKFLVEILSSLVYDFNIDAELLLVGDGPLRHEIVEISKKFDVFNRIHFVGLTDTPYLYLNCMDAFVMPSLFEGLPLSVIEAQCNGLNCFISDRIPNDCIITNHIYSLQLDKDAKYWAKQISSKEIIHSDDSLTIKKAGFDCSDVAKTIENIYSKL